MYDRSEFRREIETAVAPRQFLLTPLLRRGRKRKLVLYLVPSDSGARLGCVPGIALENSEVFPFYGSPFYRLTLPDPDNEATCRLSDAGLESSSVSLLFPSAFYGVINSATLLVAAGEHRKTIMFLRMLAASNRALCLSEEQIINSEGLAFFRYRTELLSESSFKGMREHLRQSFVALALHQARQSVQYFPPLLEESDWRSSPIHCAARDMVTMLGTSAFRAHWSQMRLQLRIARALELLLRCRAGCLGQVRAESVGFGAAAGSAKSDSVLVEAGLPEALIARGVNPLKDSRTSLAYQASIPPAVFDQLTNCEHSHARLREIPDEIERYIQHRWLRYDPLTVSLLKGFIILEFAEHLERGLSAPDGVLDGAQSLSGVSWAFRISDSGRRRMLFAFVRFAQGLLSRCLSTAVVWLVLTIFQFQYAGWLSLAWFVFASRICWLISGDSEPSPGAVRAEQLAQVHIVLTSTFGEYVSVPLLLRGLSESARKGVYWPRSVWDLVTDAANAKVSTWSSQPRSY